MVEGMSYLQLYYNKACTRELEKDIEGNYIYNSRNISINAIMPLIINLWCKNNGSHTAYECILTQISSDLSVVLPVKKEKILSGEITPYKLEVTIPKGDKTQHSIVLKLEYDSI